MMHHRIRKIRNTRRSRTTALAAVAFARDERGVQLVEVAIVIPILLMLFAAVAEFGRYFYEYTTLAKAARVGARYLATKSVSSGTTTKVTPRTSSFTETLPAPVLRYCLDLTIDNVDVQLRGRHCRRT